MVKDMDTLISFFEIPEEAEKILKPYEKKLSEIVEKEIGRVSIHFIFVDTETIAEMNRDYRGKEGPTDVLTFVYGNSHEEVENLGEKAFENTTEPYAEGYICLDIVKKNAEEYNNTFEKELLTVVVHSILHMAGYDHEYDATNAEEMFQKQEMYLRKLLSE
jgi:probable rRNA maturation factor